MRILYLGNDRDHCTERFVAEALRDQGIEVTLQNVRYVTYAQAIRMANNIHPDLVLFSKPHQPYFIRFLSYCQRQHVPTICWCWDLFWGYRPMRPPQFHADHLFTTDGGHRDLWDTYYPHHQVLRQGIQERYLDEGARRYKYDIGFVGSVSAKMYPTRLRLIEHLRKKYRNRAAIISDQRGMDLTLNLRKVRVVIGDSYPSPHYWSNRIYEMLGRSCFLLYPRTPGLEADYQEGTHYVGFDHGDFEQLDSLIGYYLAHPEEREPIRRAGFVQTRDRHLYRHRVADLLRLVGASPSPADRSP